MGYLLQYAVCAQNLRVIGMLSARKQEPDTLRIRNNRRQADFLNAQQGGYRAVRTPKSSIATTLLLQILQKTHLNKAWCGHMPC